MENKYHFYLWHRKTDVKNVDIIGELADRGLLYDYDKGLSSTLVVP
jgi:hypothetical protein